MPRVVFLETMDKVFGRLVVLRGSNNEHRVRLLACRVGNTFRQVALLVEIIARTDHKMGFRVAVQVCLLHVQHDAVIVVENGCRYIHGRVVLWVGGGSRFFVSERARTERNRCKKQETNKTQGSN